MRAILFIAFILSGMWLAENIPAKLITPISLLALAGILAGLAALLVKWVRNASR